ncbi:uracil phosphoribosyltransferase [bacterium]|nr:uracil phosphoribosyltransferase [bacterium]NBW99148.1 uracil phosphoribosyltransferase [bacterium]NBX81618.1 uracil phosphoribosyltransferase [bacterium]
MLNDHQYLKRDFKLSEVEHRYGPQFHILSDPYLFTTLARLGRPDCKQPMVNSLLNTLYRDMVNVIVNQEFPLIETCIETRMKAQHPEGEFQGLIVDPQTKVACVSLARAGIVPSQTCFDAFNYFLNPDGVRQDHISINRKIDAEEHVIGTQLGGMKIGGDIQDRIVVIPDPMGATGSTILSVVEIYRKLGKAKKVIAIHLVVTPEYLKLMKAKAPEVTVYALRLDRGLSPKKILNTVPGTHWDEEKGLNDHQYIVPGAGGLGEVINNSYV